MRIIIVIGLLLCPGASRAQGPAGDAQLGYVVRVDSQAVILDFSEKSGTAVGQQFTIFKEGEDLMHPVTGKPLGRLEVKVAEGTLREIFPLYSVGALAAAAAAQPITPGMRARLKPPAAPGLAAPPAQTPAPEPAAGAMAAARAPRWRGPSFDYQATALAVADFSGDGKLAAAVSDGRRVYLYSYPPRDAKPIAKFSCQGTAPRILSLEAADLNGNGRAEIFASLYNDAFNRFETVILELDAKSQLAQIAELPCLVRGYQDPTGKPRLAAQQVTDDSSFPFGAIYPLTYQDGKYGPGKPALSFIKRKVDWLYDFTFLTLDGKPATVSLTNREIVRIQFEKGAAKTSEDFGQTPNRVRWTGDRMLHFRPPMVARYEGNDFAGLYLIKNIAALGGLASPFGIFARGELHRHNWNGVSIALDWKAELGGYSTGLALVSLPGGTQELAVMVVGTAGKSSIWAFAP